MCMYMLVYTTASLLQYCCFCRNASSVLCRCRTREEERNLSKTLAIGSVRGPQERGPVVQQR